MINFSFGTFWVALSILQHHLQYAADAARLDPSVIVSPEERARIENNLRVVFRECANLLLPTADRTIVRLNSMFSHTYSFGELAKNLERLGDDIEADTKEEYFFHYPREQAQRLHMLDREWADAFRAYPSVRSEVAAGVDCFALGHRAGCVFYMCRAAEGGLRALARERGIRNIRKGVPLEWADWGRVFTEVDAQLTQIRRKPNGPKKEAALVFYDTSLSDLHAIQNLYRNRTMHFRDNYDPGEARSAMFRAHSLLTTLAQYLTEERPRKINWGI